MENLRKARKQSLSGVRQLINESPNGTGIIIAGREHYFDNDDERENALSTSKSFETLTLNEFTEAQIQEYINKHIDAASNNYSIPAWLPSKPLLVGYLASRGLLDACYENDTPDAIDGWDFLIDQICDREAKIDANLDGKTLRSILERVSTYARQSFDGLGPVSRQIMQKAFVDICDYEPDEQASILLQRLPGLGVNRLEDDSRIFIDKELAEVCQTGDLLEFISNPHFNIESNSFREAFSCIDRSIGLSSAELARRKMKTASMGDGKIKAVAKLLETKSTGSLNADISLICLHGLFPCPDDLFVSGIIFPDAEITIESDIPDLSGIVFKDCFFPSLDIQAGVNQNHLPKFHQCFFGNIISRSSENDIPRPAFDSECVFEKFATSSETSNAIFSLNLSTGEKVVLSILRKLYIQSISGRQESSFYRGGLDHSEKRLVPAALRLLQQEGFVMPYQKSGANIWLPVKKNLSRVRGIISSPTESKDQILLMARDME